MIVVTISRHFFINILQTQHFSAMKFYMGYEENMSFLVIPKSPKAGENVEKIGLGSFKWCEIYFCKLTAHSLEKNPENELSYLFYFWMGFNERGIIIIKIILFSLNCLYLVTIVIVKNLWPYPEARKTLFE